MTERMLPAVSEGNRRAYRITCHQCGCSDTVLANTTSHSLPPEMIKKKLQRRGWIVGGTARGDTCPGCHLKRNPPRSLSLVLAGTSTRIPIGVVEMPKDVVVPMKADVPRTTSRDDRRIIFQKLEQVYVDERTGFDRDWNDDRVAKDLGVPRAWVSTVRDENFGPDLTPDKDRQERERLEAALTQASEHIGQLVARIADLAAEAVKLRDTVHALRRPGQAGKAA